ncbi:hypothetical protein EMIHUDRAFT_445112, partial [Emiliania huxleyi CCMP1516]|uniref:Uncharacterized protein n=2 Tax=Emiliania huxleyi TaxID=2903 RepID=A0A0D3J4Z9_EMIH1
KALEHESVNDHLEPSRPGAPLARGAQAAQRAEPDHAARGAAADGLPLARPRRRLRRFLRHEPALRRGGGAAPALARGGRHRRRVDAAAARLPPLGARASPPAGLIHGTTTARPEHAPLTRRRRDRTRRRRSCSPTGRARAALAELRRGRERRRGGARLARAARKGARGDGCHPGRAAAARAAPPSRRGRGPGVRRAHPATRGRRGARRGAVERSHRACVYRDVASRVGTLYKRAGLEREERKRFSS